MQGEIHNLCLLCLQNPGLPIQKLQDIQRAMELLSCQGPAKSIDEATKHKYQFWDTQPVPKLSEWQELLVLKRFYDQVDSDSGQNFCGWMRSWSSSRHLYYGA